MLCAQCDDQAIGICRFCGDAVCPSHRTARRFVSGWKTFGQPGWGRFPTTRQDQVAVLDAAWCGRCRIESDDPAPPNTTGI